MRCLIGAAILRAVNVLANTKKHANLVAIWFSNVNVKILDARRPHFSSVLRSTDTAKDDVEIFRSTLPPERHPNIQLSFQIVIDHPEEVFQGKEPVALLDAMRSEVSRVIVATEQACRGIGMIVG
jgi:hypothetical protein